MSIRADREKWRFRGGQRPEFASEPGPGQESVWDYPRPPMLVACTRSVDVRDGDASLAHSVRSLRVLETAGPPTFYLPPDDVGSDLLVEIEGDSFCEWKGTARYFALADEPERAVAWSYPAPSVDFLTLKNYFAFYPGRVACFVDGERVRAQPGYFYGGWITSDVVGPFKGEPGTEDW